MLQSLGKVIPTPGTPLRATASQSDPAARTACHGVLVQALPTNTGKTYIGTSAINKTTLQGLHAVLPIPSASVIPSFSASLAISPNAINVAEIWIDVDNANDGVTVSVLVA